MWPVATLAMLGRRCFIVRIHPYQGAFRLLQCCKAAEDRTMMNELWLLVSFHMQMPLVVTLPHGGVTDD